MKFTKKNPPAFFNILKEPLLVQKQTIPQKKALKFGFLPLESLRAWHYQEGTTPPCPKSIFCWILRPRGGFLTPCILWTFWKAFLKIQSLSRCHFKAKYQGFLLRYRLFQYKHWFLPKFEPKDFPELTFTPCIVSR